MANKMEGGGNKVVPLGSHQQSSNAWMGIDKRIELGSLGARYTPSAVAYGGEPKVGKLFKGKSLGPTRAESNSGNGESDSNNAKQLKGFGPPDGTVGSREDMTIGGGRNVGKLAGKGVGATKAANPNDQLNAGKSYPGLVLLEGTSGSQKNLARAMKGLRTRGRNGKDD